jgi:hypothetical protein
VVTEAFVAHGILWLLRVWVLQCPAMACWVDAYVGTGVFIGGGRREEGGDSQLYDVTVLYYATAVSWRLRCGYA